MQPSRSPTSNVISGPRPDGRPRRRRGLALRMMTERRIFQRAGRTEAGGTGADYGYIHFGGRDMVSVGE